jgi:hypothetical protein
VRAAQQQLERLAEQGAVMVVGSDPRDPRRRWYLSMPGNEG